MNKVLLFAHLRDTVGQDSVEVNGSGLSIRDLKKQMAEKYELKLDNIMVSVNEEFAEDDEVIKEGDIVAFIPPVSGG